MVGKGFTEGASVARAKFLSEGRCLEQRYGWALIQPRFSAAWLASMEVGALASKWWHHRSLGRLN